MWSVPAVRAGDGLAALQTAEASCADGSADRYVDCGNGTVTDTETGLVWLADASCLAAAVHFDTALEWVAGLSDLPGADADDCGLEDGSSPGEWRLPSKGEWQAMVAAADGMGCSPAITDDAGTGCWTAGCVSAGDCTFFGVSSSIYWSSTTTVADPAFAHGMILATGSTSAEEKDSTNLVVWPVRGGQ